jgi:flagella basal body P-ring formation protein FlgA
MARCHKLLCSIPDLRFSVLGSVFLLMLSHSINSLAFLPLSGHAGTLQKLTAPAKFAVTGDKVTLGALLALDPQEVKLAAQLDAVVLTTAPAPGQTKFVAGAEILRRLESVGVTGKTSTILVPAEVTIVREAQTVTAADISQRIKDEFLPGLPWKDVRLERVDLTENILLPKGKTEWIFTCHPGTDYAKPFYLNINFSVNGDVAKRAFVRTALSVYQQVAVTLTELRPNQSIREEDIRWESQRLPSTLQIPIKSTGFLHGRRPRMAISPGRVLTENLFIEVPLVKRGDSVLLVFESEGMRVTTQAKALAMGFRGQRIQVVNPDSGRVLSAEVTDEGTARVVH